MFSRGAFPLVILEVKWSYSGRVVSIARSLIDTIAASNSIQDH